ncbi:YbaB/EbfC family nucleoid-associated protein [Micromonospora sp. 4G57]|uniref:YbaB/EbfC family nucleoid-associated protein n=1 Tax=Micromonospora sicca TaxID=2202420 RepID=A0ABU5JFJ6_9ACTN|nr:MULTISPECIES: YbaB/EbfC family nucleoid-associated protein [unclassified Micromonospora]MDZ5441154.1 YbaB/EbfC family nucleoid-associated protein [Micromonospora sp. 4G57]MDZ5491380.1 YbaB/EbfC family nucleoid-associated protein [Micromonospora sp. 4G53]
MSGFEAQIQQAMRQVRQRLDAFEQQRTVLAETVGEGTSEDGLITARVGAGGAVQDLEINPRAMRLDSHTLRDSILAAIRAATANWAETVREATARPPVDPEQLLRDFGVGPELKSTMAQFSQRAADIEQNLAALRRDLAG